MTQQKPKLSDINALVHLIVSGLECWNKSESALIQGVSVFGKLLLVYRSRHERERKNSLSSRPENVENSQIITIVQTQIHEQFLPTQSLLFRMNMK